MLLNPPKNKTVGHLSRLFLGQQWTDWINWSVENKSQQDPEKVLRQSQVVIDHIT